MKPRPTSLFRLPHHLTRYLRGRHRRHQRSQEQWLNELAAATPPDGDGLPDLPGPDQLGERMLNHIRAHTQPEPRAEAWAWGPALRVAAALVPLLLAGVWLWGLRPAPPLRYVTGIGEHRRIVLPDRSRVWLRPRSELTCAATFAGGRTVQLRGEAFFAVTKDARHPFVVRTAAVAVRVLGTSFGVKAYPQLPATTVLVRTGRVEVSTPQRVLGVLRPQDKLVFSAHSQQLTLTHHEYTDALTSGRLTFEQASLHEILLLLENYYPVRFVLPRRVPTVALSGTLDPALAADQVTDVLNTLLLRHHLRITKRTATTYEVH